MQVDEDKPKIIQDTKITSTVDPKQFATKTQHAFDAEKQEWKLEKDAELPMEIQEVAAENGDEPRKKHARMRNSGSESSDSPAADPVDDSVESVQVDDSLDLEESKPLLSASDVSSSASSGDEAPPVINRLPMAKVTPISAKVVNKSNNCYEEMDEEDEEESDLEEPSAQNVVNNDSIFGPRAETLFVEYMAERTPDFDPSSLDEDEILSGLSTFRSAQQFYQMLMTRNMSHQVFNQIKFASLKAIDHLCKKSEKNRFVAGRLETIPLILQFAIRQEGERLLVVSRHE